MGYFDNPQQSGFDYTVAEIGRMVVEAKRAAGIGEDTPLESLVSGCGLFIILTSCI